MTKRKAGKHAWAVLLGRRGGKKGGRKGGSQKTDPQTAARRANMAKARAARWSGTGDTDKPP